MKDKKPINIEKNIKNHIFRQILISVEDHIEQQASRDLFWVIYRYMPWIDIKNLY